MGRIFAMFIAFLNPFVFCAHKVSLTLFATTSALFIELLVGVLKGAPTVHDFLANTTTLSPIRCSSGLQSALRYFPFAFVTTEFYHKRSAGTTAKAHESCGNKLPAWPLPAKQQRRLQFLVIC